MKIPGKSRPDDYFAVPTEEEETNTTVNHNEQHEIEKNAGSSKIAAAEPKSSSSNSKYYCGKIVTGVDIYDEDDEEEEEEDPILQQQQHQYSRTMIMSPEGIEERHPIVVESIEEDGQHVLRISSVKYDKPAGVSGGESRRIESALLSKKKNNKKQKQTNNRHQHILAGKSSEEEVDIENTRKNKSNKLLSAFFGSSMWRKRAKNFIPLLILIIYSACGGLLFWLLEGRGRQEVADRERAIKADRAELVLNQTVQDLIGIVESAHDESVVAYRLAEYNYTKLDRFLERHYLERNYSMNNINNNLENDTEILINAIINNNNSTNMSNLFIYSNLTSNIISLNCSISDDEIDDISMIVNLQKELIDLFTDALNDSREFGDALRDRESSTLWMMETILRNYTSTMQPLIQEHDRRDWTFWGSMFYAGTIYTTIGYGYMTAQTDLGRAMTMVYALMGIPLVLYTLNQLGRFLCYGIWKCYNKIKRLINLCRPKKYRRRRSSFVRSGEEEIGEFPFVIAIGVTIGWMLMCSAIFCTWEKWSFFVSFYFFFQSLTTIGFGDVKPTHPEYLVWNFVLIIIGLALVSMCWSLLQMKLDYLLTMATKRITQQFVNLEMQGGHMTTDASSIENEIERISAGESRWLSTFMNDNRRRVLIDEWSQRAHMFNKACQTDTLYADQGVQSVADIDEKTCQTPIEFLSPSRDHQKRQEVPLRETRRRASPGGTQTMVNSTSSTSSSMGDPRVMNDEFKALLHGLRNILGECQDTLSVTKETTTSFVQSTSKANEAVNHLAAPPSPTPSASRKLSRASTTASVSMIEF